MSDSEHKKNAHGEEIRRMMAEKGWTQKELASRLRVSRIGLNLILGGNRTVSSLMALKLAAVFGEDPDFFLAPQRIFDLEKAYQENRDEIEKIREEAAREGEALGPNTGVLR